MPAVHSVRGARPPVASTSRCVTNLWLSDGPKIQFALSAYVHAYPDNVLSVWVYVATLEDLRAGGRPRVD